MAVSPPELALKHRLRRLRRHHRRCLRRLAQTHRPARNHHVRRNARLGSRRSAAVTSGIRWWRINAFSPLSTHWLPGQLVPSAVLPRHCLTLSSPLTTPLTGSRRAGERVKWVGRLDVMRLTVYFRRTGWPVEPCGKVGDGHVSSGGFDFGDRLALSIPSSSVVVPEPWACECVIVACADGRLLKLSSCTSYRRRHYLGAHRNQSPHSGGELAPLSETGFGGG